MLPHFEVEAILEVLQRHSRVPMFAAPTMLIRLVHAPAIASADLHNLRTIFYEWGEEVVAFVVARPSARVASEYLDRLCLNHIARFKRPRHYRFVDALPKNNYGKVLKTELRRLLAQSSSQESGMR